MNKHETSSHRVSRSMLVFGLWIGASASFAGCVQEESKAQVKEVVGEAAKAVCGLPDIEPAKSLFVVEPQTLSRFPLVNVLTQILSTAGVAGPAPLELYQRLWDTQNRPSRGVAFNDGLSIHCDSELTGGLPSINGFPITCPRNEGQLALTNPFPGTASSVFPVAVVNRFDLAPTDGSHCGEYRVVYAKNNALGGGRNFIIFEGVLPNPSPECGVLACRPVAEFWANLTSLSDPNNRADQLEQFFFTGIPGFEPVIAANHYGLGALGGGYGATSKGQVRTNQFMTNPPAGSIPTNGIPANEQFWQLREFQLERVCKRVIEKGELDEEEVFEKDEEVELEKGSASIIVPKPACFLRFKPVTVKNNPFGPMFNTGSTNPRTASFRLDFVDSQVEPLTSNSVDEIAMNTPDDFNAGQSTAQPGFTENDYGFQLTGNTPLIGNINARLLLPTMGFAPFGRGDLSADNIADRATSQSCAGCHRLVADGTGRLGGEVNPRWPQSNGFVHVSEGSVLSNALKFVFLPQRRNVMNRFLDNTCGQICDDCGSLIVKAEKAPGSATAVKTVGGKVSH